jgi:hypothetical protein
VVGFNLHFNTVVKAEIMGLYKRWDVVPCR